MTRTTTDPPRRLYVMSEPGFDMVKCPVCDQGVVGEDRRRVELERRATIERLRAERRIVTEYAIAHGINADLIERYVQDRLAAEALRHE